MNEQLQKRRSELEAHVANVQADLEVAQGNGFTPGSAAARENDILLKGYRKQLADFQAQIASIDTEARRFEKARQEAEEIHARQEAERQAKAEAERRKAEEAEAARRVRAEKERERQAKAEADRKASAAQARQEAIDLEYRRTQSALEQAERLAQAERERQMQLGAVLTGPNGEEATKFRLKVPGGHVVVQFIPEVSE